MIPFNQSKKKVQISSTFDDEKKTIGRDEKKQIENIVVWKVQM